MTFTKADVLNSINIALTDELLSDINMGMADVYHIGLADEVVVSTGLDTDAPERYVVSVRPLTLRRDPWLSGRWIQTISGQKFDLSNPDPAAVDLRDIAHALGNICRFTGHVRRFYSVAQHCLLVATILEDRGADPMTVYAGLLHDAAEAYVTDVSTPLKSMLSDYPLIEDGVAGAIYDALDLDVDEVDWEAVKEADLAALFMERRDLLTEPADLWEGELDVDLPEGIIIPLNPDAATISYLLTERRLREEAF